MLNDIPNNSNWKNKLEELESSEDEVFNKDGSWNKLHKRLQLKRQKRKTMWYWLAAACLLFAVCISFFLLKKKENVLVKNDALQKKINSPSSPTQKISNDTPEVISSLPSEDKMPVRFIDSNNKMNVVINHKIVKNEMVNDVKNKYEIVTNAVNNNAVMPVDTVINIAVILPEKKKLKVVHINELGEPVTEAPNIARLYDRHSFQLHLMSQESYATSSNFVSNKRLKNFTIINLPSN